METCEQCGDEVESEMIEHAKKYNQAILCKGCDEYFSKLGKSRGREGEKERGK